MLINGKVTKVEKIKFSFDDRTYTVNSGTTWRMYFSKIQTEMESYGVKFTKNSTIEYHNYLTELSAWANDFKNESDGDGEISNWYWYNLVLSSIYGDFDNPDNSHGGALLFCITDFETYINICEQLKDMDENDPNVEILTKQAYELIKYATLDEEIKDGATYIFSGAG